MMPQSNPSQDCTFCTQMTMEKKLLFFSLFKAFSRELQMARRQFGTELAQTENGPFKQLLRIIFAEQALQHENICQHQKYLTYFTHKLACSENDLNYLSQKMAQRLAEKHYHLQLLSIQVKNSAESIVEGKVNISDQDPPSFDISSQQRRYIQKSHVLKRKEKTEMEANECTINTGSTLTGSSLSYIPIFNSQFNLTETVASPITFVSPNQLGYYYPYSIFYPHQNQ